jgi:hypothetical protein
MVQYQRQSFDSGAKLSHQDQRQIVVSAWLYQHDYRTDWLRQDEFTDGITGVCSIQAQTQSASC